MKIHSLHTLTLSILLLTHLISSSRILTETQEDKCNHNILNAYGLEGNHTPVKQDNPYCPNIRHNCCSRTDNGVSSGLWEEDASKKISAYYETYLYSLKYILGFVEQANLLAEEMLESPRNICKKAGEEFKHLGLTEKNSKQIFMVMMKGLKTVAELRRGFLCNLCDGDVHEQLTKTWESEPVEERKIIKVSESFCENLVEKTIPAAFFEVFYIKEIAEIMSVLVSCGKNIEQIEKLEYELPVDGVEQVKNCFHFREKYFFYHCSSYCERFNFARAIGFFDGNLEQLRKFVQFFKENRKGGFPNCNSNFMVDLGSGEENFLEKNFEEFGRHLNNNELFFVPEHEDYAFDKMEIEVALEGGIDLFPSTFGSMYPLILNFEKIMSMGLVLIISWMLN